MAALRLLISAGVGVALAGSSLAGPAAAVTALAETPTASPETPPETPPSTEGGPRLVDGVFTSPDGSFSVRFAEPPAALDDPPGYLAAAGDDAETITAYPLDAFGGTAELGARERANLFLDASGTSIELLANTPTRLGPYPAAYFIARLDLNEGGRGAVYGVVVVRGEEVDYVIYTDIGGDDPDTGRAFVESFTLWLPAASPVGAIPPAPTGSEASIAPSVPDSEAGAEAGGSSVVPAPPTTVLPAPIGATPSFDGRWWITFPAPTTPTAPTVPTVRASSERGFAFTEYRAVAGDDVLTVRVTLVPAGYDWEPTSVDGFPGVIVAPGDSESTGVAGRPAVRSTFPSGSATVHSLVVDDGDQLVTVAYTDAGDASTNAADSFLESLGFV